jgi:hypothetical protein
METPSKEAVETAINTYMNPAINRAILAVQKDIDAIDKNRQNSSQGGYAYRGIDDVINEIHPLFVKSGIFITTTVLEQAREERATKNGGLLIYRILKIRFAFHAEDGSKIECEVVGEGMDAGDKSSNKAMSVALKYAILQMFTIPTKDFMTDPEVDSPEPAPKAPKPALPWREVAWHLPFGNNEDKTYEFKGKKLGEIYANAPKGFAYWARTWKPISQPNSPLGRAAHAKDAALRAALDEATLELAKQEAAPPEPNPDPSPSAMEPGNFPEGLLDGFRKLCERHNLVEEWTLEKINAKRTKKAKSLADLDESTLKKAIININWFVTEWEKENAS